MFLECNHHRLLHLIVVSYMEDAFLLAAVIQGTRNSHAKNYN
jgi:hypothetical protein